MSVLGLCVLTYSPLPSLGGEVDRLGVATRCFKLSLVPLQVILTRERRQGASHILKRQHVGNSKLVWKCSEHSACPWAGRGVG